MLRRRVAHASSTFKALRRRRTHSVTTTVTPMAATTQNEYILLTLDYVDDMLDKRGPHREEHIAGARKAHEEGKCAMAGALTDPVDTGVFVFKNVDAAYVERFVQNDAYYKAGLVPTYSIRPWMVVVGNDA